MLDKQICFGCEKKRKDQQLREREKIIFFWCDKIVSERSKENQPLRHDTNTHVYIHTEKLQYKATNNNTLREERSTEENSNKMVQ